MSDPQRSPDAGPELAAAIDLGSNSFHMVVARFDGGQIKLIDRLREPVRLAAGMDAERRIGPAARRRALDCLARFGQRLRDIPPEAVRAVGTNTLRQARDAREFLAEAEQALGHGIEVVAGIEEARLIYLGVAHSIAADASRRLVVDIGGGSTELIVGEGFQPLRMESLHMGCVSSTRDYFAGGISRRPWEQASLAAHLELEGVARRFRDLGWQRVVGSSGTVKATAAALKEAGWSNFGISLEGLRKLRDQLLRDGKVDRGRFPSVGEDRAEVFAGGVVVLLSVFEALGLDTMEVAEGALREGLLYDLLGRIHDEDVRAAAVADLTRRYHVEVAQARRVAETAARCLEQTAAAWALEGEEYARLLAWAAELHEIGLDIAHSQYHKHGAYVLANADLAGFSRQEQQLLAMLVRAHRRKLLLAEFRELPERLQTPARRLALLLRLAVLLHRARSDEPLPEFRLGASDQRLALEFADGWLAAHPLLRADLEQEQAYLRAAGLELDFS